MSATRGRNIIDDESDIPLSEDYDEAENARDGSAKISAPHREDLHIILPIVFLLL